MRKRTEIKEYRRMYPFKGTCSRSDSAQVRHIYQGLMAGLFFACPAVSQAALHFPSSMLSGDPGEVADLSHFSQAGAQLPGVYDVEVFLNNQSVGERSLRFVTANDAEVAVAASAPARSADTGDFASPDIHDHTGLVACITMKMWRELGLKTAGAPEMDAIPEDLCVSPGQDRTLSELNHIQVIRNYPNK
jgi:outer membrane usher protein